MICIELEAVFSSSGYLYCTTFCGTDKMPIARVAGVRHEDLVAGLNQGHTRQVQGGGCSCRYNDSAGGDVNTKPTGVPVADAFAQAGQSSGWSVLRPSVLNRLLCCCLYQGRGGEVGFSDIQKNHGRIGVCDLLAQRGGGFGYLHDIEGLYPLCTRRDLHGCEWESQARIFLPWTRSDSTSAPRKLGAIPLSTAFTYLYPSVPPNSLASSMHSLSTTRQGTS